MAYNRNKPAAADILSDSQVDLETNTNGSDDSFGIDHYSFSDLTANNGKHNVIQTVSYGTLGDSTPPSHASHPTTTTDPKFYAYQDATAIGILQYSRGTSDKIQTPVSCLQSGSTGITLAPLATTSVLDFTALPQCYGTVSAIGTASGSEVSFVLGFFRWNQSLLAATQVSAQRLSVSVFGNILQIINGTSPGVNVTNLAWTLRFDRILTPT